MEEYRNYLADQLLADEKVVTYRMLSRALGVHVDTAKQMLYEFHSSQNAKRRGAVNAIYLIYGKKPSDFASRSQGRDGEDVEMADGATEEQIFGESVSTCILELVVEEELEDILAEYEEVSSIHIYSISPFKMKDLLLLSDIAYQVYELVKPDATQDSTKLYGTIPNTQVRRRERKGGPVKTLNVSPKSAAKSIPTTAAAPKVKEECKTTLGSSTPTQSPVTSSAPAKKPTAPLKHGTSANFGIMQAFSKAKPKTKPSKAGAEISRPLSDDGEADDSEMPPRPRETTAAWQTRKEREEALKRMMDDDDEGDAANGDDQSDEDGGERAGSPEPEPMEEDESAPEPTPAEEPAEVVSLTTGGKRRGRRKAMKKKQIMDDEGYLVTVQEPGWESFSEEECPPPKPQPQSQPTSSSISTTKANNGVAKGNQGSIMSFFSKK